MKTFFRFGLILLLTALAASCNLPLKTSLPKTSLRLPGGMGPQAWIDAPLDGMHLPLGLPYDIVFHLTADSAVVRGELSVNGQVLATLPNPVAGSNLATLHQLWTPPAPGEYTIRARAESSARQWGDYAQAVVEVDQPTSTPTTTPTATAGATPTAVGGFGPPSLSSTGLYYGAGNCSPKQVTISVAVSDPRGIKVVVFFFQLTDQASRKSTDWSNGQSMNPSSGGIYTLTLQGDAIKPKAGFAASWVVYQFVAQPKSGDYLRSPVYSNLVLASCSGGPVLPVGSPVPFIPKLSIVTPTPFTPPIIK